MRALRTFGSDDTGRSASDRPLLEDLYRQHSRRVYGFILARSGSRTLAEELTGDTFVAAAKGIARDRSDDIDCSWLITVARRRLIDHWRRRERQRQKYERLRVLEGVKSSVSPGSVDHQAVSLALEALSERHRAALALRYLDDHSVAEVADILDLSYHAAESLIGRARQAFIQAYDAQGEDS